MYKKFLLVFICICVCVLAIVLVKKPGLITGPRHNNITGRDSASQSNKQSIADSADEKNARINELLTLPYLQGYHPAPNRNGVTVYDKSLAYKGYNLYVSGHAPEAGIMDMEGNVLHRWTFDIRNIWPEIKPSIQTSNFRRVHLYDNGDILAIHPDTCMIKLDRDSRLIWGLKCKAHHHMQVLDDGTIYLLTRETEQIPRIDPATNVRTDYIVVITPQGTIKKRYSLLECFENSEYAYLLEPVINKQPDRGKSPAKKSKKAAWIKEIFHTNTIQVFDGSCAHISPLFNKGNIMIAPLRLNTVAIIDLQKKKVEWALEGKENNLWIELHEPVLLENGNILLFSNKGNPKGYGHSKIIEFNHFTKNIEWEYRGTKTHPFDSASCGTNQRLPNGNTLITESDKGRAFEVNKQGTIVWEYINPKRTGDNNELIATLLHVDRIDKQHLQWLLK